MLDRQLEGTARFVEAARLFALALGVETTETRALLARLAMR